MSSQPGLHRFNAGKFLPQASAALQPPATKAAQTAWERWEMASFAKSSDASAGDLTTPPPEPAPLVPVTQIDEAELAELRLQAHKAGEAEGREQGHARGLAEGHAAGLAAVQAQAAQLLALAQALPAALQLAQNSVADDLLALALDIARQVLGQALAAEPQAILAVVHELLQAEPSLSGAPQLLLHPDDAVMVKELLADDLKAAGWRVRTDAQIARGGCRVMAHSGERDATVQARWERVSAALVRHPAPENLAAPESAEPA
ncbi:Flagellar assembly protein FliH [Polaromonas sp. CG9_12]|uniref:flagellar assembly protein FliH n=1 Tax=Polaromonas sp. CG_9.11 TaxID=2787730 RepID=UPI0004DDCDFF|nr:flagellar assembly protein FliH [Polaromonas sp. CG_9.11]MBG6077610.1 flagellar assembly protein FliH [Polaromonas sp. CG_9.11]CDS50331.1 Flagellar assembly protein FliH [Polaromonas sp. CG9_12]